MKAAIAVLLLLCASVAAGEPPPSALWKARAFEAAKRVEAVGGKRLSRLEDYQLRVEMAFGLHLTQEDFAHKVEKGEREAFRILLFDPSKERGQFMLSHLYERGRWFGSRIDMLPKGWLVLLPEGGDGERLLISTHDGVLLIFGLKDPFTVMALEGDESKAGIAFSGWKSAVYPAKPTPKAILTTGEK